MPTDELRARLAGIICDAVNRYTGELIPREECYLEADRVVALLQPHEGEGPKIVVGFVAEPGDPEGTYRLSVLCGGVTHYIGALVEGWENAEAEARALADILGPCATIGPVWSDTQAKLEAQREEVSPLEGEEEEQTPMHNVWALRGVEGEEVEPVVVAELGTGEVAVITVHAADGRMGMVFRCGIGPHEIGEDTSPEHGCPGEDMEYWAGDRLVWFGNPESLDVVIEDLLQGREDRGWGPFTSPPQLPDAQQEREVIGYLFSPPGGGKPEYHHGRCCPESQPGWTVKPVVVVSWPESDGEDETTEGGIG